MGIYCTFPFEYYFKWISYWASELSEEALESWIDLTLIQLGLEWSREGREGKRLGWKRERVQEKGTEEKREREKNKRREGERKLVGGHGHQAGFCYKKMSFPVCHTSGGISAVTLSSSSLKIKKQEKYEQIFSCLPNEQILFIYMTVPFSKLNNHTHTHKHTHTRHRQYTQYKPLTLSWQVSQRRPWGRSRPLCWAQRWMARWCTRQRGGGSASSPHEGW